MKVRKKAMWLTLLLILILAISSLIAYSYPAIGRAPSGERLERILYSSNYRNGHFHNQHATVLMTSKENRWKALWKFLFAHYKDLKPSKPLPTVKTDLLHLDRSEEIIVWFGHSSLFIQTGGKRILVDPVLTSRLPVSLMMRPFKDTDIYSPDDIPEIDYLLITHDHWDHLDYGTVKSIKNRVGKVICPLGVGEDFEYWGYSCDKIIEMDWNETLRLGGEMKIHCLPARHFSGRFLNSNVTLWASFLIDGPKRIYLSGDSGYDTHFLEIGKKYPDIDLAIMENGQYNKDWNLIHDMPDMLPQAIADLHPKAVMTVHNSKFALSKHPWYEPLDNIYRASQGKPYKLLTPMIGEKIELDNANYQTKKWW